MNTMVPAACSPVEGAASSSSAPLSPAPWSSSAGEGAAGSGRSLTGAHGCICDRSAWRFGGRADGHELTNCERPEWLVCVGCDARSLKRCGRASRAVCGPCSETYRRRVARVALSGFVARRDTIAVLTLTAPGDREHRMRSGEVCPCTPVGGVDLATWNGSASARWSRFMDALRYHYGDVQYFRGAEVQKRGALHFHAPLRFPPGQLVTKAHVRELAIAHGFGHSVELDVIDAGSKRAERAGWYVAKYVTKSAGEREAVPFVNARTGEVGPGRWRTWTSSRQWGQTMAGVRAAQRGWVQAGGPEATPVVVDGPGVGPEAPLDPNTLSSGIRSGELPIVLEVVPM